MDVPELDDFIEGQSVKHEVIEDYSPANDVILMEDDSLDMSHFEQGAELGWFPNADPLGLGPWSVQSYSGDEIPVPLPVFCESEDEDNVEGETEVIVQIMDIRTRLSKLRSMLEQRICADLTDYTFWLQDVKMLENHKTLVEQCVRGEGVVQVNIQVKSSQKKINILDVLKPDEEVVQISDRSPILGDLDDSSDSFLDVMPCVDPDLSQNKKNDVMHAASYKWIVDEQFKKDQERLKIPADPAEWTIQHVRLWVQWAVRHFKLHGIKLADWNVTGDVLVNLTHSEFRIKVPNDPGDIFWTHFELLRKCKFVVVQSEDHFPQSPETAVPSNIVTRKKAKQMETTLTEEEINNMSSSREANGQIQLWQFLLDLLTNAHYTKIISWHGTQGEFKFLDPEKVARLWGIRKNKPAMNYEKLSRALRYYYDGNMIAKVRNKRFVYKFVCNLEQLIGFNAVELSNLVNEANDSMQARRTLVYNGH